MKGPGVRKQRPAVQSLRGSRSLPRLQGTAKKLGSGSTKFTDAERHGRGQDKGESGMMNFKRRVAVQFAVLPLRVFG
jgi:hypothetical protein